MTAGDINTVTSQMLNVDRMTARGVDLEGSYTYDHYAYGTFGTFFRASYLDQLEQESQFEGTNQYAGDFANPRWRARLGLNWVWQEDHDFSLFTNYRHRYKDTTLNVASETVKGEALEVKSMTTFDLTYQYTGLADLVLEVGVLNVADEDPSYSNYGDYGAAIFTDSVMGRTFIGSVGYTF